MYNTVYKFMATNLSYRAQAHLPGDGTTHSGLDIPTSMSKSMSVRTKSHRLSHKSLCSGSVFNGGPVFPGDSRFKKVDN